jgi:dTDP-4-dehydrorhamnose 3,5-epimerase
MNVRTTVLPGVLLVEPNVVRDERGFFVEAWSREKYRAAGIDADFLQDNHSSSRRGVLRGLHMQYRRPQAKLVRVVAGEIFDVAVDVRRASPTYGRHVAQILSAENFHQLYIPAGYAHGFVVLSGEAQVQYKVDDLYDPGGELTVLWNDPELGIPWPVPDPVLSAKDQAGLCASEVQHLL